jgi:hypothetical protein
MNNRSWGSWILALAFVFVALVNTLSAQNQAKRLILKDGSYQLATQWEVKGDRVRYLSAERNEWEELPYSLVDWAATDKYEKDRAAGVPSPAAIELDKELATERAEEAAKTPQVAPGLHLPDDGTVMLLDTFQSQPQLIEMQQSGGEVNRNTKRYILRATVDPIASSKRTLEINGLHATIQAHASVPSIYVNLDTQQDPGAPGEHVPQPQQPQQPEQPWDRFRIVRAQAKNGKRIVGVVKISPIGKSTQQQDLIPTTAQRLTGSWVKVTPNAPLEPGEYAVVELLGSEGMNTFVWDFGVNPSAPANAGVLTPEPAAAKANDSQPK